MERLLPHLRIEICKYLNGTDIVNLCEAAPSMKSVLRSLTIQGILRSYVRQMEWMDARLCRMLYSTPEFAERETDSTAEAKSDCDILYRAIRWYQDGCQLPLECMKHDLPNGEPTIHFLLLGRSTTDLDVAFALCATFGSWERSYGQRLYQNCSLRDGHTEAVIRRSNFDIHFNVNDLRQNSLQTSVIRGFDCVVYMIDCALHFLLERTLPRALLHLIYLITRIAVNESTRPQMLLILDTKSRETENLMSRDGDFERLVTSLHRLDRIALQEFSGSASSPSPYNWWRVCRLHQQNGMFVNLYEVLQMTALQIVNTNEEGSCQDQSTQGNDVPAHSPAM